MTISRRKLIQVAGVGAAALALPKKARAAKKTLRIIQWNHFVPGYDKWFNGQYIKEWGEKNDTEVIVDNVGIPAINPTAAAEVSAKKGHDLFMFLWPRPAYEEDVIDHKEIYQECEKKWGKPIDLAIKSTYNAKTKKYFGFSDMFVPDPVNYRKDLFDQVGGKPDTWEDIRKYGKMIKDKTGIPVGVGQAAEIDTAMAVRAILYSFGGGEQDEQGNIVLNSKHTVEAVKFVKALYEETMTPEVLSWDASSNNRAMLAGKASVVLNAISVTREGENKQMPIVDNVWLAKAAKGPVRRMGLEHVMGNYVIWKFAENIEGAKKFLVDLVGNYDRAFDASEGYNFPCFTKTVPKIKEKLAHDSKSKPPDKYAVLTDALDWATNVGYPGYSNAAIDEIYSTWVLNTMFGKASTGAMSPEDAVKEADAKCRQIWQKWKERKLL
ncbi:MAG TPA: extracellular solute-binding protein [Myxococcales bacterium]|jgi:multiple sugar transport system substrate-binding protein|nr:extracellular solute-binding protein [Myxococcales bacterium]